MERLLILAATLAVASSNTCNKFTSFNATTCTCFPGFGGRGCAYLDNTHVDDACTIAAVNDAECGTHQRQLARTVCSLEAPKLQASRQLESVLRCLDDAAVHNYTDAQVKSTAALVNKAIEVTNHTEFAPHLYSRSHDVAVLGAVPVSAWSKPVTGDTRSFLDANVPLWDTCFMVCNCGEVFDRDTHMCVKSSEANLLVETYMTYSKCAILGNAHLATISALTAELFAMQASKCLSSLTEPPQREIMKTLERRFPGSNTGGSVAIGHALSASLGSHASTPAVGAVNYIPPFRASYYGEELDNSITKLKGTADWVGTNDLLNTTMHSIGALQNKLGDLENSFYTDMGKLVGYTNNVAFETIFNNIANDEAILQAGNSLLINDVAQEYKSSVHQLTQLTQAIQEAIDQLQSRLDNLVTANALVIYMSRDVDLRKIIEEIFRLEQEKLREILDTTVLLLGSILAPLKNFAITPQSMQEGITEAGMQAHVALDRAVEMLLNVDETVNTYNSLIEEQLNLARQVNFTFAKRIAKSKEAMDKITNILMQVLNEQSNMVKQVARLVAADASDDRVRNLEMDPNLWSNLGFQMDEVLDHDTALCKPWVATGGLASRRRRLVDLAHNTPNDLLLSRRGLQDDGSCDTLRDSLAEKHGYNPYDNPAFDSLAEYTSDTSLSDMEVEYIHRLDHLNGNCSALKVQMNTVVKHGSLFQESLFSAVNAFTRLYHYTGLDPTEIVPATLEERIQHMANVSESQVPSAIDSSETRPTFRVDEYVGVLKNIAKAAADARIMSTVNRARDQLYDFCRAVAYAEPHKMTQEKISQCTLGPVPPTAAGIRVMATAMENVKEDVKTENWVSTSVGVTGHEALNVTHMIAEFDDIVNDGFERALEFQLYGPSVDTDAEEAPLYARRDMGPFICTAENVAVYKFGVFFTDANENVLGPTSSVSTDDEVEVAITQYGQAVKTSGGKRYFFEYPSLELNYAYARAVKLEEWTCKHGKPTENGVCEHKSHENLGRSRFALPSPYRKYKVTVTKGKEHLKNAARMYLRLSFTGQTSETHCYTYPEPPKTWAEVFNVQDESGDSLVIWLSVAAGVCCVLVVIGLVVVRKRRAGRSGGSAEDDEGPADVVALESTNPKLELP